MAPYEEIGRAAAMLYALQREKDYGIESPGFIPKAQIDEFLIKFVVDYLSSYTDPTISASVMLDFSLNEKRPSKKAIWLDKDTWYEQMMKMIAYAVDQAGPGVYKQVSDVIWSLREEDKRFDRYGNTIDFITAAGKMMGISQSRVNPTRSLTFLISQMKRDVKEQVGAFLEDEAYSKAFIDEEKVMKDYRKAQRAWFEKQQLLYFSLEQYKILGLNEKKYKKEMERLTEAAGVSDKIKNNIKEGIFTPWDMPKYIRKNFEKNKSDLLLKRNWPKDRIAILYTALKEQEISLAANYSLVDDLDEMKSIYD